MTLRVQASTHAPGRFRPEVGERLGIAGPAAAGVADGVSKTSLDEVVAEVAADANAVVADPAGVDGVDASKARRLFCCISQA